MLVKSHGTSNLSREDVLAVALTTLIDLVHQQSFLEEAIRLQRCRAVNQDQFLNHEVAMLPRLQAMLLSREELQEREQYRRMLLSLQRQLAVELHLFQDTWVVLQLLHKSRRTLTHALNT